MDPIKLTDRQVKMLSDISRGVQELTQRRQAMLDMVVAGAGGEPAPVRIEERDDGIYLVPAVPPEE